MIERRSKGRGCKCNEGKRDEKGKARRKDQKHLDIWSFERTKIQLCWPKKKKRENKAVYMASRHACWSARTVKSKKKQTDKYSDQQTDKVTFSVVWD